MSDAEPTELLRYTITGSLLFASYTALTCPCKHIEGDRQTAFLSCHIGSFSVAVAVPLLVVLYINRYNLME